jgi:hypothetical protein
VTVGATRVPLCVTRSVDAASTPPRFSAPALRVRGRRAGAAGRVLPRPAPAPKHLADGAGPVGQRRCRQRGRHAQDAAPVGVLQLDPPHRGTLNGLLEAVQLGERLIEEGIIAVHQPEHALVLAHDAFEEQTCFVPSSPPQAAVIWGNTSGSNVWRSSPLTPSHWAPKPSNRARARACSAAAPPEPAAPRACAVRPCRPGRTARRRAAPTTADRTNARPTDSRPADDFRIRVDFARRRDEEELRRDEDRLPHQAQRRRVTQLVLAGEVEDAHQDIQLRLGGRPTVSIAGQRARDLAGRLAEIGAVRRSRRRALLDRQWAACPSGATTCAITLLAMSRNNSDCMGEIELR